MGAGQCRGEILVVEDDVSLAELLCEVLDEEGYRTRRAGDGHAALAAGQQRRPALVLTDIVMPECDGMELLMALRGRHPSVPVVAMSGGRRNTGLYLHAADRLGAVTVLQKPFTNATLLDTVERALGGASPA